MAQERFFEYKADDRTAWLNRKDLGMLPEGVYKGFDIDFANTTGTDLHIYHSETGYKDVTTGLVESSFKGVVKTRQGTIIIEDAALVIGTAQGMTGNAASDPRIDIVYVQHQRVEVTGGTVASYGVKTGTAAASPTIPTLTNPLIEVPIAYIYWPASTSDLSATGVRIVRLSYIHKHEYTQPRIFPMTYNATTKNLTSQYRGNWFYIDGIDGNYKQVLAIETAMFNPEADIIHIYTNQRLWIDLTQDFSPRARDAGKWLVEAGETISFIRKTGLNTNAENGYYARISGDHMGRNTTQKITGQLIQNRGTTIALNTSNGEISLGLDGNSYELSFDFATLTGGELTGMTSFASYWDGFATNTKDGATVILHVKNTGAAGLTIKVAGGATPSSSAFAPFTTEYADLVITDEAYLILLEHNTEWKVLGGIGANENKWATGATLPAFTANTGSVTVNIADVKYNRFKLSHSTLSWHVYLTNVTISGAPSILTIPLPSEITARGLGVNNIGQVQVVGTADASTIMVAQLGKDETGADAPTKVSLNLLGGGNFTNGSDNQTLSFNLEIELSPL